MGNQVEELIRLAAHVRMNKILSVASQQPEHAVLAWEALCSLEVLEDLPSRQELWKAVHKWERLRRSFPVTKLSERSICRSVVEYCRDVWDVSPIHH